MYQFRKKIMTLSFHNYYKFKIFNNKTFTFFCLKSKKKKKREKSK